MAGVKTKGRIHWQGLLWLWKAWGWGEEKGKGSGGCKMKTQVSKSRAQASELCTVPWDLHPEQKLSPRELRQQIHNDEGEAVAGGGGAGC